MKLLRVLSGGWFVCLILLLAAIAVTAQKPADVGPPAQPLAGKYQGVAKGADGDSQVTMQLAESGGKFSGHLGTGQEQFEIVKGQLAEGLLSLELDAKGSPAKLSLRQREGKLVGELSRGALTKTIELKRVDEFSGDWDAVVNLNSQNYPFSLTLKVEGEKVTGSSSSEIGSASITKGLLKDGRLVLELTGESGAVILLDATLKDGNLIGNMDFNGMAQGSWVAVRRK